MTENNDKVLITRRISAVNVTDYDNTCNYYENKYHIATSRSATDGFVLLK